MKKFTKLIALLAILIFAIGTLTVQAAPDKVQTYPKSNKTEKIVFMDKTKDGLIYMAEKDIQELKSTKEILKFKVLVEPSDQEIKIQLREAFKFLTPADFWAVGITMEINMKKETIKFIDIQFLDEKGEIVVYIGDIYIKNFEEIPIKDLLAIASSVKK